MSNIPNIIKIIPKVDTKVKNVYYSNCGWGLLGFRGVFPYSPYLPPFK